MLAITSQPIVPAELERAVAWPGAGAVLSFSGVVRDNFEGRAVRGLEYEAYQEMAIPVMEIIRDEIQQRWPEVRVAMAHRIGRLEVGEVSVTISVASPHRAEAYQASRYAIDELKTRVPIWKKELYQDSAAWKANQPSPPQASS